MLRVTLAGLWLHLGRFFTTAIAIALGVLFVSGTLTFSGILEQSFEARVMGSATGIDAIVTPEEENRAAPMQAEEPETLPEDMLERIRDLPEAGAASGMVFGHAALLDREGRTLGMLPTAAVSAEGVSRFTPAEGRLPESDSEAALSQSTAEQAGYEVGDTVTVLDHESEGHDFTVTGLVDFGVDQRYAYTGAVVYTESAARELTGESGYAEINVLAAGDRTAPETAEAVAAAVDGDVRTGEEYGAELAEAMGADAGVLRTGLLMFALVAMFVAALVIYNTFAILLAQRQRDLALLRCVGVGRGRLFRSVLLESAVVGLVASLAGSAAGVGLGHLAAGLAGPALGMDGGTSAYVDPVAMAVAVAIGTAAAVLSALLPAVRATRVPPLAALRTSAATTAAGGRTGRGRITAGIAVLLVSAALVAVAQIQGPAESSLVLVVAAGFAAFLGVVVLGPLLVRAALAPAALLLRRFGVASTLAVDNIRRSPARAAASMVALAVGATLITGYSVVSASLEATMDQTLEEEFPVDYEIFPPIQAIGEEDATRHIPGDVRDTLTDEAAVGDVFVRRSGSDAMDGEDTSAVTYVGGEFGTDLTAATRSGDVADLAPGSVLVSESSSGDRETGESLPVATPHGEQTFEIAAVVEDMSLLQGVVLHPDDFTEFFPGVTEDELVLVRGAEGAEAAEVREAVYRAVEDHPALQVMSQAEMRSELEEVLQIAFFVVAGMLGLALLIAVFGIANTLALSVLERTRESALLRALGLARGRLRTMLGMEAVLLSLIGAGVGIVLGIGFGWAAGAALLEGMVLAVPVGQIALFIAIAVLAGLAASVLPGRRAARTSITAAMSDD